MTIKTIQNGGVGGLSSTIDPALKVFKRATTKKQNIKTNSQITCCNNIVVSLSRSNFSCEALPERVSSEKIVRRIINAPNSIWIALVLLKYFLPP